MNATELLQKVRGGAAKGHGRPGAVQAREALQQLRALDAMKDVDPRTLRTARKEILAVLVEYRRDLKVKKEKRRKHTRG